MAGNLTHIADRKPRLTRADAENWLGKLFETNQEEESAKADFAAARDHLLAVQKTRKQIFEEFNAWMRGQLGLADAPAAGDGEEAVPEAAEG